MPCIFLDRDGVINKTFVVNGKPIAPRKFSDFKILFNVKSTLIKLKELNYKISIFTNQPDVNYFPEMRKEVDLMHIFLQKELPIDFVDVCFHKPEDKCQCRKPKTGMLKRSSEILNINLRESIVVGDRWSDIKAGQDVGARCFFIDYNYKEKKPEGKFIVLDSLQDLLKYI